MSTFPSVKPASRAWSPGARAQTIYQALDGVEVRFVHGTRVVGQRLTLVFENVSETEGKSITDHYASNGTTYGVFDLPAAVFAGMNSYDYTNEATNSWRYAGPPQVSYITPGYQTVSVELLGVSS
jgi:hypothetical protein